MTTKTKLSFDLEDITNIRFTCNNSECGGEVSCPPSAKYKLPNECPYCQENWTGQTGEKNLLIAIRDLLRRENGPIRLDFELDFPSRLVGRGD